MSFLTDAAKYYKSEPHQIAAWEELEGALDVSTLEAFKTAYRASQEPSVVSYVTVTRETFADLTGYAAHLFSTQEVDDCNEFLKATGFGEDPTLTSMLMANILHETGNLKWMKELADGWAYEGRTDLGNTEAGDGPRFKGAGVLQLTGRYNYSVVAEALSDPRIMEGVEYVSQTYPFRSAIPWIQANDLLNIAKTEGFAAVCYRINGGWNGYSDRLDKYQTCQKVFCL